MTPLQLARQSKAGKASFRLHVQRALATHPGDLDMAARHLSGTMRFASGGFAYRRGVTAEYMRGWAERLKETK